MLTPEGNEAKYAELADTFGELEFNPESNPEHERLRQVARNIIDCYDWQPAREDFLIVTDTKVVNDNPVMLRALEYELQKQGVAAQEKKAGAGRYKFMVTATSPNSATPLGDEIGEAMHDRPVLIITSMSRSHSKETGAALRANPAFSREDVGKLLGSDALRQLSEAGFSGITKETLDAWNGRLPDEAWGRLRQLAKDRRMRLISITKGHNPYEILTKGAVYETVENLKERADKLRELLHNVKRVHITSELGTDLWLTIRPDLDEVEDGRIDKPGKLANYPIGEWSCSPDWKGSNGVMVVDGPCGGNINQHILDRGAPLRLTIKDGEIVSFEGGEEALKLWRAYLDSGNNDHNDAYRLAEFGIGTNSRALEDKPREYWGSTEGEKVYRSSGTTVHVAVGSNGSFGREPGDANFNAAQVHCDMVLGLNPGGEVSVECERQDGSTFTLIEKGKPIEY